jgi:anti-sigma-K factor RskA
VVKAPRDDRHLLTGCYALDALPEPERREFERHLPHCASCDAEVSGLRETAARLAAPKALFPPPGMRDRVLAATYRTRQLPPLPDRLPDRLTAGRASRDHRRFRLPRLAAVAAAACVAIAVGAGAAQVASHHQPQPAEAGAAAITRVITAPDARTQSARARGGGSVTVVVSARQQEAVVTAAGMPSLPSARAYQVWVISPAGARSAGVLAGAGRTSELLAAGVRPGDRIGITVEPAGGTSRPTTSPIVVVSA